MGHHELTEAFELRYPWPWPRLQGLGSRPKGDPFRMGRPPFLTVWHKDPRNGECPWTYPRLTEFQQGVVRAIARWELKYARLTDQGHVNGTTGVVTFIAFASQYWWQSRRRDLSPRFIARALAQMYPYETHDWHLAAFAHAKTEEQIYEAFLRLAVEVERLQRPWWRHPRWHVHHWQIQIHPLRGLLRRLFTRCSVCRKRIKKGQPAISTVYEQPEQPWYLFWQGDRFVRHAACDPASPSPYHGLSIIAASEEKARG